MASSTNSKPKAKSTRPDLFDSSSLFTQVESKYRYGVSTWQPTGLGVGKKPRNEMGKAPRQRVPVPGRVGAPSVPRTDARPSPVDSAACQQDADDEIRIHEGGFGASAPRKTRVKFQYEFEPETVSDSAPAKESPPTPPAPREPEPCCAMCWRSPPHVELGFCGGCNVVRYCGAQCAQRHWVFEHHSRCSRAALEAEATASSKVEGGSTTSHPGQRNLETVRESREFQDYSIDDDDDEELGGGRLLEGEYNEAENASAFQQALLDWRSGKTTEPEDRNPKPDVASEGTRWTEKSVACYHCYAVVQFPVVCVETGLNFCSEECARVGIQSLDPKLLASSVEKHEQEAEEGLASPPHPGSVAAADSGAVQEKQAEPAGKSKSMAADAGPKKRTSCYQCFKVFMQGEGHHSKDFDKEFCGQPCRDKAAMVMKRKCTRDGCYKMFLLKDGVNGGNHTWFCSSECTESMEELD